MLFQPGYIKVLKELALSGQLQLYNMRSVCWRVRRMVEAILLACPMRRVRVFRPLLLDLLNLNGLGWLIHKPSHKCTHTHTRDGCTHAHAHTRTTPVPHPHVCFISLAGHVTPQSDGSPPPPPLRRFISQPSELPTHNLSLALIT